MPYAALMISLVGCDSKQGLQPPDRSEGAPRTATADRQARTGPEPAALESAIAPVAGRDAPREAVPEPEEIPIGRPAWHLVPTPAPAPTEPAPTEPATADPATPAMTPTAGRPATASLAERLIPLGSFRWRDHAVQIYAGQVYTVEDAAGQVVAAYITEAELAAAFPQIMNALQTAFATDAAWAGSACPEHPFPRYDFPQRPVTSANGTAVRP
jgi:hypothetical protein